MPCKLGITSMSLGRANAGHTIEYKLDMAFKYGYKGIELFIDDLVDLAARKFETVKAADPTAPSHEAQLGAARHIRALCTALGITIICLQPFAHYEGLVDRAAHRVQLAKLRLWLELVRELGTDMIQIPSSFLPAAHVSDDMDLIVADLRELADLGARVGVRFVYEALCWGTRVDTWEASWEVVRRVDRPNFGLCLDTFNIAGRIYADPTQPGCEAEGGAEAVRRSVERLLADVDVSKLYYVQIVDAKRLALPLVEGHPFYIPEQPARMTWSRNCRLFYGEKERGAFLPVRYIAEAFFHGLGFEGWVSLELFNRRMGDFGPEVVEELARRGAVSWHKLVSDLGLRVEGAPVVEVPKIVASPLWSKLVDDMKLRVDVPPVPVA